MVKPLNILTILVLFFLSANITPTFTTQGEQLPPLAAYSQQDSAGSGNTIYLPLVSSQATLYRINARLLSDSDWLTPTAIFWFGRLSLFDNYQG